MMSLKQSINLRGVIKTNPLSIHTHNLCGGVENSKKVLKLIEDFEAYPEDLIPRLKHDLMKNYDLDAIYRDTISLLATKIKNKYNELDQVVISGGQHWDWFFSFPLAEILGVNHYFIFKNLEIYNEFGRRESEFSRIKIVHVSSFINEGESLAKYWKPAWSQKNEKIDSVICLISDAYDSLISLKEISSLKLKSPDLGL